MKKKFWPKKLFGRLWRLRSNFDKFFWKKKISIFSKKIFLHLFHSKKKSIFQKKFSVLENGSFFEKSVSCVFFAKFSLERRSKNFWKIFSKFGVREKFFWKMAQNRQKSPVFWPSEISKIGENRQSVRQSSRNRLGPTVKVPQNFALSSKNTLTGPNSFSSPSYGQNENFGVEKKIFFSEKFFFDRKVQKKWVFKKGIFGPFGAHLGELERFWVFGHFLGRF